MELTIFGAILGSLIAALITIYIEALRKPSLKLQVISQIDLPLSKGQPATQMRSIRVRLTNRALPRWVGWMYRNPALQCHGNITFHDLDDKDIFGRSMNLRWVKAPEPNPLVIRIGNLYGHVFDPIRITQIQKMDIYPGESEDIDIAARFDNDTECYGWSNESYFSTPRFRTPSWCIVTGIYIVKVNVLSSGKTISGLFRLMNDGGKIDFRLEDAMNVNWYYK